MVVRNPFITHKIADVKILRNNNGFYLHNSCENAIIKLRRFLQMSERSEQVRQLLDEVESILMCSNCEKTRRVCVDLIDAVYDDGWRYSARRPSGALCPQCTKEKWTEKGE